MTPKASLFQRIILPGFAFKAVVIGGGYATGRELVEFFFPGGPLGGLLGLLVTALLWSAVCAATFVFAWKTQSLNYRAFFERLLGPFWILFEIAFIALMLLILSVFAAAAGEIGTSLFGVPALAGMLFLAAAIVTVAAFGSASVERLFKYVSVFLYATYAIFIVLAFSSFGDQIARTLADASPPDKWLLGGVTYASYNLVGAVVILPVIRHMTSRRDAVAAGLLCGPLAALPAVLFFIAMLAFYPEIGAATLPSDYLLSRMNAPVFHFAFQAMIFAALLETGTGLVHALNERIASTVEVAPRKRLVISAVLVVLSMFVAARIGLVDLIGKGYGASAYVFLAIYIVPLFTIGLVRILRKGEV